MTLFLTWQSAEINSRPLTRRQSPLKEGCIHRMAARLFFKGKVVSTRYLIPPWFVPQSQQRSTGPGDFSSSVSDPSFLYLRCGSTLRFLLTINNLAFAWSSFSKLSDRWRKTVSTRFYLTLRTNQSKALMLFRLLCCLNWSVDPRDTVEVLFLSLD